MRILVADDDPAIRDFLDKILTRLGHEPTCCSSGKEAILMLNCKKFDLVITDIVMPEEDGIGVIRHINNLHLDVGIITISGGSSSLDTSAYLHCAELLGSKQTLQKPFSIEDLQSALDFFDKNLINKNLTQN